MKFSLVPVFSALCAAIFLVIPPNAAAQAPEAALVRSGLPDENVKLAEGLAAKLQAAGYAVRDLSFADLCNPETLCGGSLGLLVLPNSAELPANSVESIGAYLKTGGDILALNAPLWQKTYIPDGETWTDLAAYRKRCAPGLMQNVLFDFSKGIDGWNRTTNDPDNPATHVLETGQPDPIGAALHVAISRLNNWDTFVSPPMENPFPEGHTLTVFYAKGGPQTTELSVEWTERDLSRWIAVVPLTSEWQQYVLEPKDFHYWESVPARAQDTFHPENAVSMTLGLALTHTHLMGDQHEYWVGPIGTASRTADHEKMMTSVKLPALELLSSGYKFYPCSDVASLAIRGDGMTLTSGGLPLPADIRTTPPRPRAAGYNKGRDWRWAPLLEARTAAGEWRGTPASMLAHVNGPCKGGVWASFAISDLSWYETPEVMNLLGEIAAHMRDGLFLVDAGTNFFTYFAEQEITLGLRAVNLGAEAANELTASVTLTDPAAGTTVFEKTWPMDIAAGTQFAVSANMRPESWPEKGLRVSAVLRRGDVVVDRAEHDVFLWKPKEKPAFMTVENGDFMLNGKRWRAHGVNYMPSSGVATEDGPYFEQWLSARSYDPEVIQRDLRHIVDMGLNAVSIFIYRDAMEAQNLLDLLRRLDELGLKANLSLRPGTPMDFEWEKISDLIQYYRLAEQDTVFALDLAWEPMFPDHEGRKRWDAEWRAWIDERYGSIENAEKDWGFAAPRDDQGEVINPLGQQTMEDGDWRVMTAAYRRFLDTLLYKNYNRARRLVRSLDPNHLVSFRMAEAGNPEFRWEKAIPYDWPYLSSAVDILEPEAYGRIGDWEKVKPGWFEFEYARWAAPERPMMWAEAGVSAWVESLMRAPQDRLDFQAAYFTNLYRMFTNSGVDGVFFWWYPGGYRTGERSDFGIIEPDGSDRAVTKVIRDQAAAFLNGPDAKPVDQWIEIDRDTHAGGVNGVYLDAKEAFWKAIDDGHVPGLKTAGTATTSANCPLIAVGNTPFTGMNPLKYLDGFFDAIEIQDHTGKWVNMAQGAAIRVKPDAPVVAKITFTNLAEAAWVAPASMQEDGGVQVVLSGPTEVLLPIPENLPRGHSQTMEVPLLDAAPAADTPFTLTFEAKNRGRFGPKRSFTVQP